MDYEEEIACSLFGKPDSVLSVRGKMISYKVEIHSESSWNEGFPYWCYITLTGWRHPAKSINQSGAR